MSEAGSLTNLLLREIRDEVKAVRHEVTDVRILCLSPFDRMKRLERRLEDVRDDVESTLKAEVMRTTLNWRREAAAHHPGP